MVDDQPMSPNSSPCPVDLSDSLTGFHVAPFVAPLELEM